MLRRNIPEMSFDPEINARDSEIRTPINHGKHETRFEKEGEHEQAAFES